MFIWSHKIVLRQQDWAQATYDGLNASIDQFSHTHTYMLCCYLYSSLNEQHLNKDLSELNKQLNKLKKDNQVLKITNDTLEAEVYELFTIL